jgi:acyl carrier protein
MESLHQQGYEIFLEIGAKPILLGMGRSCLPEEVGVWLPSLRQGQSDWQQLLQTLGELYIRGLRVNWSGFDRDYERYRLGLPTYPFQRQRYWIEATENLSSVTGELSQLEQTTKTFNLLSRGETEQLTQYLEKVENFSEDEAKLLPKLLEALFKQHQQEQIEVKSPRKDESLSEPYEPELLQLLEGKPPKERLELLLAHIQSEAANILGLGSSQAPSSQLGFFEMGMDSLLVVEFRNRLTNNLRYSISSNLIFNYPTIEALAGYLARELFSLEIPSQSITTPQIENQNLAIIAAKLEEISEEEMEALVLQKLQTL